jgi:hypothetical protein
MPRLAIRFLPLVGASLLLGACSRAPGLTLAGSYVPAWLACAVLGVVAAIAARAGLVAAGLGEALPWPLLVCGALGCIVASLVWLAWVGA